MLWILKQNLRVIGLGVSLIHTFTAEPYIFHLTLLFVAPSLIYQVKRDKIKAHN